MPGERSQAGRGASCPEIRAPGAAVPRGHLAQGGKAPRGRHVWELEHAPRRLGRPRDLFINGLFRANSFLF